LTPVAPIAAPTRSVWQCRALALGVGLLFAVDGAMAQDQRASFDIPAQPLADALVAYGAATGIELFYDGALAMGRRSTAVTGVHQSMVALQILLRGTGHVPRATDHAGTVTIVRAPPETAASQTVALGRYEPFFAALQAKVSEVLCKSDEAKPGDEQILLSFWFDPAGMVSHVQVLDSEMSRDRAAFGVSSAPNTASGTIGLDNWLASVTGLSGVTDTSTAVFALGKTSRNPARAVFESLLAAFVAEKGLVLNSPDPAKGYKVIDSSLSGYCIVMPVSTFKTFYNEKILPNMAAIRSAYTLPAPPVPPVPTTTSAATVVRTGTGDVSKWRRTATSS